MGAMDPRSDSVHLNCRRSGQQDLIGTLPLRFQGLMLVPGDIHEVPYMEPVGRAISTGLVRGRQLSPQGVLDDRQGLQSPYVMNISVEPPKC